MKITLSTLTTKNLATLTQRIINLCDSDDYAVIKNHTLLEELKNAYNNYDAVYAKRTYSGKGSEVALADKERYHAFGNLKAFLNGYRKINSVPHYQDAAVLYQVFVQFGLKINKLSYSSESALLIKLIEALETPENLQRLTNLSLLTAFNDLKSKHLAFEVLFAEQAEANGELRQTPSATALRKEIEFHIRSLLNLIKAMQHVSEWSKLYLEVNEIIKAAKNSNHQTNDKN